MMVRFSTFAFSSCDHPVWIAPKTLSCPVKMYNSRIIKISHKRTVYVVQLMLHRPTVATSRLVSLALTVSFLASLTACSGGNSGGSGSGGSGGSGSGGGGTTTTTPSISSISPAKVTAGSAALTLTISGSGFTSGSVVVIGGISESTTYVSASQLTATVPAT